MINVGFFIILIEVSPVGSDECFYRCRLESITCISEVGWRGSALSRLQKGITLMTPFMLLISSVGSGVEIFYFSTAITWQHAWANSYFTGRTASQREI